MNLIKMDFTRMRKSLSTYIILVCLFAFASIFVGNLFYQINNDPQVAATSSNFASYFQSIVSGNTVSLFIGIFAALFVNVELQNGAIKNIFGKETRKYKFILSKLATVSLYVAVVYLLSGAGAVLINLIRDKTLTLGTELSRLLGVTLTQFAMAVAFGALTLAVATIVRSNGISLIISIIFCMFGSMFEALADMAVRKIPALNEFSLAKYGLMSNIEYIVGLESAKADCVRALIIAIVITAVSVVAGSLFLSKKDVK